MYQFSTRFPLITVLKIGPNLSVLSSGTGLLNTIYVH